MARSAKSPKIEIDELSHSVVERFDAVEWNDFNASEMARRGQVRTAVLDIRDDLMRVAAVDAARAARIWDEHVPSFVPRPYELPVKPVEILNLNTIEPARRRRRSIAKTFVEEGQSGHESLDQRKTLGDRGVATTERDPKQKRPPVDHSLRADEAPRAARTRLLMEGLNRQYLNAEDRYHFRDKSGEVAFEAQDRRLVTRHDAPAVVASMIDLAEARGWSSLKLSGSEDFRREAWLQASVRGLETNGYKPNSHDRARLDELHKERTVTGPLNSISEGRPRSPAPAHRNAQFGSIMEEGQSEPRIPLTAGQDQFLKVMEATMRHRGDSAEAIAKARELANERLTSDRVHVGILVEIGTAPYQDKRGGKPSHFVTLDDENGQRAKVWGVDLPRALEASGAAPGKKVVVVYRGQKPVAVDVAVKDGKGQVVRSERQVVERNTWEIVQFDLLRNEAKASVRNAMERQNNPGSLNVFDRSAQALASVVDRHTGQARERSRERFF